MKISELSKENEARFHFYRFNDAYFEAMYELNFDFAMDYIEPFDIDGCHDSTDLIFCRGDIGRFVQEAE